jgi:hypothetical protein
MERICLRRRPQSPTRREHLQEPSGVRSHRRRPRGILDPLREEHGERRLRRVGYVPYREIPNDRV